MSPCRYRLTYINCCVNNRYLLIDKKDAFEISIVGLVQGVGFRPHIYRLAVKRGLSGWVKNRVDGVRIRVEGNGEQIRRFLSEIPVGAPSAPSDSPAWPMLPPNPAG